jgi:CO/xanthine dehydrogenase Mo-binding subunit
MVMVKNQPKIKNVWCAVDCGLVINKDSAKNMIEGSIIDGIGHALYSELNFKDGAVTNNNFDKYNLIRFNQAPINIEVFFVDNKLPPTGLGEPGLPPAIGALANSLYRITGKRFYEQPFLPHENII